MLSSEAGCNRPWQQPWRLGPAVSTCQQLSHAAQHARSAARQQPQAAATPCCKAWRQQAGTSHARPTHHHEQAALSCQRRQEPAWSVCMGLAVGRAHASRSAASMLFSRLEARLRCLPPPPVPHQFLWITPRWARCSAGATQEHRQRGVAMFLALAVHPAYSSGKGRGVLKGQTAPEDKGATEQGAQPQSSQAVIAPRGPRCAAVGRPIGSSRAEAAGLHTALAACWLGCTGICTSVQCQEQHIGALTSLVHKNLPPPHPAPPHPLHPGVTKMRYSAQ